MSSDFLAQDRLSNEKKQSRIRNSKASQYREILQSTRTFFASPVKLQTPRLLLSLHMFSVSVSQRDNIRILIVNSQVITPLRLSLILGEHCTAT